jgi:hypothetical protein
MALFFSPHLVLRCKRPSLRPAWTERIGVPLGRCNAAHDSGRGTGQRVFIRKMRPFEECHTFALGIETPLYSKSRGMGASFQKRHRLTFYGTFVRPGISAVNSPRRDSLSWRLASISALGRLFAGMGAFDSFGRSLNAIFEKRPPCPIRLVSSWIYNFLLVHVVTKASAWHCSSVRIDSLFELLCNQLFFIEGSVNTFFCHKCFVDPLLHQFTTIKHQNPFRSANS